MRQQKEKGLAKPLLVKTIDVDHIRKRQGNHESFLWVDGTNSWTEEADLKLDIVGLNVSGMDKC